MPREVVCYVRKECRLTGEDLVKGVVLYGISAGKIYDSVLVGVISHNNRPYFGPMDEEDMVRYAHSDFGDNRGYNTEFCNDPEKEELDELVREYFEEVYFSFTDGRDPVNKEEAREFIENVYVRKDFEEIREEFLSDNFEN